MFKKKQSCRLCLIVVNDENRVVIEETIKEVLDVLLLKLHEKEKNKSIMCNACSVKLFAAFNFKATCTDTEDRIFPYVDSERGTPVDLREIYLKERGKEHLKDMFKHERICRLCMQVVTCGFTPAKEVDVHTLCQYIPEVNLTSTTDPVMCKACIDSLDTHTGFLKGCFNVEEKIKNISVDKTIESLFHIITEEIELKSEDYNDPPLQSSNVVPFEESDCSYESKYKSYIKQHQLKHKDHSQVQMYRCNDCDYESKYKIVIKRCRKKQRFKVRNRMNRLEVRGDCCRPMADIKETSCRHCLENITADESFEMKFGNESKEAICNVCRRKLNAALEFKSTCLNTDNTIIPYVDSEKMLQLDLREVYMQEKKSELVCGQKISRLCMHPVESEFKCIREVELEAIQKLIPEMDINIIKDPVVCKQCLYTLCTHNSFINDCSEVEERKSIFGSSTTGSQIDTSPLDLLIKTENLDKEFDINEMEMSIKPENMDIKSENEERSNLPLQSSYIVPFEESDCKNEIEDGCKHENGSVVKTMQERQVLYKCDKCIYETGSKIRFTVHKNDSELYKCESCEYETENKKLLQRHLLRHKDPSKVQTYRCNDCDYKTVYKSHIQLHQPKHKDPLHIQIWGRRWMGPTFTRLPTPTEIRQDKTKRDSPILPRLQTIEQ
ncbi:uncharacterized protein LOC108911119 [Anoplophora glabripennis]|uniref:uncharacterized protein LOC108911119 n=1 Tax=Anoplophora glabripennis TaxID=217634 RepID=UPI0008758397|nr:uncharacterized protein LOC108911119 [Anoplophora glabripennis]